MLNRKITAIILILSLLLMLTACQSDKSDNTETQTTVSDVYYSFTDYNGTEIVLEEKPQTVAVLFSSFADVWKTAGGSVDITVGESIERGFADSSAILVDSSAGKTIDTEALVAANPDFVICSADLEAQNETAELLNSNGIPCAAFHVETFDEYLSMLKICTDITGDNNAYETYGVEVGERIDEMLSMLDAENLTMKNILFIRAGSSGSSTKAKTADDNFVCYMLKEIGTYNIAENAAVLLDGLSFEEVLNCNPDYIFISTMGDENAAKEYLNSVFSEQTWQSLTAIKNSNYTFLPKDMFQYKPNAHWDEAYRYLIDIVYP